MNCKLWNIEPRAQKNARSLAVASCKVQFAALFAHNCVFSDRLYGGFWHWAAAGTRYLTNNGATRASACIYMMLHYTRKCDVSWMCYERCGGRDGDARAGNTRIYLCSGKGRRIELSSALLMWNPSLLGGARSEENQREASTTRGFAHTSHLNSREQRDTHTYTHITK